VGYYASMININAYHQPGVEAGKRAADKIIDLQLKVLKFLSDNKGQARTIAQISQQLDGEHDTEYVFKICEHLSANRSRSVIKTPGESPFRATYMKI